jgi:hypothetical protein
MRARLTIRVMLARTMSHQVSILRKRGFSLEERMAGRERMQAEMYVAPRTIPTEKNQSCQRVRIRE